jgi:hypothetical protein
MGLICSFFFINDWTYLREGRKVQQKKSINYWCQKCLKQKNLKTQSGDLVESQLIVELKKKLKTVIEESVLCA